MIASIVVVVAVAPLISSLSSTLENDKGTRL